MVKLIPFPSIPTLRDLGLPQNPIFPSETLVSDANLWVLEEKLGFLSWVLVIRGRGIKFGFFGGEDERKSVVLCVGFVFVGVLFGEICGGEE